MGSRRSFWGLKGWFLEFLKSRNNTCHTQFQSGFLFCSLISFHPTLTWRFPPPSYLPTESVRQKKHLSSLCKQDGWAGHSTCPGHINQFCSTKIRTMFRLWCLTLIQTILQEAVLKPCIICYQVWWSQIRAGKRKPKQFLRFYFPLGKFSHQWNE